MKQCPTLRFGEVSRPVAGNRTLFNTMHHKSKSKTAKGKHLHLQNSFCCHYITNERCASIPTYQNVMKTRFGHVPWLRWLAQFLRECAVLCTRPRPMIVYLHPRLAYDIHTCLCVIHGLSCHRMRENGCAGSHIWGKSLRSDGQKSAKISFAPKNHTFSTTNQCLGTVDPSRWYDVETGGWYLCTLRSPWVENKC